MSLVLVHPTAHKLDLCLALQSSFPAIACSCNIPFPAERDIASITPNPLIKGARLAPIEGRLLFRRCENSDAALCVDSTAGGTDAAPIIANGNVDLI